jgi:5-hydroxyisourate hydrolase-like protein (transthyretin family)
MVQLQLMCTNNGKAIEGARVAVVTRVGSRQAVARDVVTDGAGRALVRLAAGPGRAVTVAYRMYADDPVARAMASLKVTVKGRIRLRGDRRKLRNGKALRLRGRLLGGYVPRRGVTLNVQWKDGQRWRPFAQIKTNRKGSFSYAYRFTRTTRPVTYTLRVQATKGQLDYPFLPVASNAVKVTVMP